MFHSRSSVGIDMIRSRRRADRRQRLPSGAIARTV